MCPYFEVWVLIVHSLGVNITAFGRKFTLFQRHPAFHFKYPAYFAYLELEKNALYPLCSALSGIQTTRQPASSARQS